MCHQTHCLINKLIFNNTTSMILNGIMLPDNQRKFQLYWINCKRNTSNKEDKRGIKRDKDITKNKTE